MGKICKYSNLYDKDGKLIRSVDSVSGRLDDYTIEELENLVDELAKDETKRTEYTNSMSMLMHMYETKGNPHKDEIVQKVNEYAKTKTTKSEVTEALNEVNGTIAHENFKKQARENDSRTERVIQKSPKRVRWGEGQPSKTDTTISTAA